MALGCHHVQGGFVLMAHVSEHRTPMGYQRIDIAGGSTA
jgi:hypothetical protein